MSKKVLFLFSILLFVPFISSEVVVNSQDWREISLGINYAELQDEEFRIINNIGEARLGPDILNDDKVTVLNSRSNYVIKNYSKYLESRGFKTNSVPLSLKRHTSLYSNVDGFVIVNPDYSEHTITAFPKLIQSDYGLIYNTDNIELTSNGKEKIFYGSFPDQPWQDLNNYKIIDEGNHQEDAKELTEGLDQKSWIIGASGKYIEPGYITEGQPISILRDPSDTVKLMERNSLDTLELIGPELGNYGKRVRSISEESISVILKTSRTFTGNPELSGREIPLQRILTDYRLQNISVDAFEDSNTAYFSFQNSGNQDTRVEFKTATLYTENGSNDVQPERNSFMVPSNSSLIVPAGDVESEINRVELLASYSGRDIRDAAIVEKRYESPNLNIVSAAYTDKLRLEVHNPENRAVKVKAWAEDLQLYRSFDSVQSEEEVVNPGKNKELIFDIRMNKSQLENNQRISFDVAAGFDSFTNYNEKNVKLEVTDNAGSLSGNSFASYTPLVLSILILVLLLAAINPRIISERLPR